MAWSNLNSCNFGFAIATRTFPTATVFGGRDTFNAVMRSDTYNYNPSSTVWTSLATMITAAGTVGAARDSTGTYRMGGRTLNSLAGFVSSLNERFANGAWSSLTSLPTPARNACDANAIGGEVYVMGGVPSGGGSLTDNDSYTISTDSWAANTDLPASSAGGETSSVGSYIGTAIYRFKTTFPLDTKTDIYATTTDSYSAGADETSLKRISSAYFASGTNIYKCGGSTTSNLLIYSTTGDSWSSGTALPNNRLAASGFDGDTGFGYVTNGGTTATIKYDVAGDSWSTETAYPIGNINIQGSPQGA